MTAQFQFFQSLPHKKADFVKKKPVELGVFRDLSRFVETFNVNIFSMNAWGPSRRVVTWFISLHTYAWLEMGVNIKQFVSVAVNRRMAAWGPCIILTQHYPANITIFFQK